MPLAPEEGEAGAGLLFGRPVRVRPRPAGAGRWKDPRGAPLAPRSGAALRGMGEL